MLKKEILIEWKFGEYNRFFQKTFAQGDTIIPKIKVLIKNAILDNYYGIIHFKMPDGTTTFVQDDTIENGAFDFEIPIAALSQIGTHEINFEIKSKTDDSTLAIPATFSYDVITSNQINESCQAPIQVVTLVVDLVAELNKLIDEAKGLLYNPVNLFTTDTVQKNVNVDTGIRIDQYNQGKKLYASIDTTNSQNIPFTAYKGVSIGTLLNAKGYVVTELSSQGLEESKKVYLSFYLSATTDTIHYICDWGSDVIAEGLDIILN